MLNVSSVVFVLLFLVLDHLAIPFSCLYRHPWDRLCLMAETHTPRWRHLLHWSRLPLRAQWEGHWRRRKAQSGTEPECKMVEQRETESRQSCQDGRGRHPNGCYGQQETRRLTDYVNYLWVRLG
jgi:hypothetical protein